MLKKILFLLFSSALLLESGELSFPPDSLFRAEEIHFKLFAAFPNWKGGSTQNAKTVTFPGEGATIRQGVSTRRGEFRIGNFGTFALEEQKKAGMDHAEFQLELNSASPVTVQLLAVTASIPFPAKQGQVFRINGRRYEFPEHYVPSGRWQIGTGEQENRIEIPLRRGVLKITGMFRVQFQDNRKYNNKTTSLRLIFSSSEGAVTRAGLTFRADYEPYASTPLKFSRNGGETQSPLSPGVRRLGGILFLLTQSALPTGQENRVQSKNPRGNYCYILRADETNGPVEAFYSDGSSSEPELLGTYPVGEKPDDGLTCFAYRIADKPLRGIRIADGKPLAVSISGNSIQPSVPARPLQIRADKDWKPVTLLKDVRPGSALDFSSLLDAPAGKYGFLKAAGEQFEFENRPGVPVRFWGINVTSRTLFMANEDIDRMVERFAANGYNLVRFHHFDACLAKEDAAETVTPDPAKADRLDYFLAACKKRGLYVSIDLYMSRKLKKGEIRKFPEKAISGRDFKALALIDEEVMQNLERYSENLLTRVSPYTKLRWVDDPALATVSIINEGTLINNLHSKYIRDIYDAAFRRYPSKPGRSRSRNYMDFLHEVQRKAYARYSAKLRSMGVKVPLTNLNYIMDAATSSDRRDLDYVDIHYYWAHPTSSAIPRTQNPEDALGSLGGFSDLFPHRAFGRPFAVTEWNYVFPNAYRAEGGFLTGAYSALQGYSMLCRFDYASNPLRAIEPSHIIGFELANDPVARLSDLAGALFFLRGDVASSDRRFAYRITEENRENQNTVPDLFRELGLIAKTGFVWGNRSGDFTEPPGNASLQTLRNRNAIPAEAAPEDGMRRSSTGEIQLQTKQQSFQVVTPRSEAFIGPAGKTLHGKTVSVKTGGTFSALLAASCDTTPLAESRRILILHLTDCLNSGLRFTSSERHTADRFGALPVLLRRSTAEMTLRNLPDGDMELYALDLSGKRIGKIPVRREKNRLMFRLDNSAGIFAYELIRK